MTQPKTHVLVDIEVLKELQDQALWLDCLDTAGVDNWDGYDYAAEIYSRIKDGKETL
jgi:hypothetical protein